MMKNGRQPIVKPIFEGVPQGVADAFLRGLDDVKDGRTVSIDSALAEGRRRIIAHQGIKRKLSMTRLAAQTFSTLI